jgi:hypothetical protein
MMTVLPVSPPAEAIAAIFKQILKNKGGVENASLFQKEVGWNSKKFVRRRKGREGKGFEEGFQFKCGC